MFDLDIWSPFRRLHPDLSDPFQLPITPWHPSAIRPFHTHSSWFSPMVKEDGSHCYMVNVPGWSKEDLKLTLQDRTLEVNGEKEGKNLHWQVDLDLKADLDTLSAECKDGVLTISYKEYEKKVIKIK